MKNNIRNHIEILRQNVFEINTKWPQFELLLKDAEELSQRKDINTVCGIERTLLYGGYSLFGPLFEGNSKNYFCVDSSPISADERGAYCKNRILHDDFIKKKMDIRQKIEELNLNRKFDLIIIPNLVHHVFDQNKLIKSCYELLNHKGKLYIFEPTLRELHQIPNDYLRWTPFGLNAIAESNNFNLICQKETGNAFDALRYSWYQAIEYLEKNDRSEIQNWLEKEHIPFIEKLEKKSQKSNQLRKFTRFPTAFSCLYEKL